MTAARVALPVPNSGGTSRPRFKAPANACDCHVHVYDPRFPMAWRSLPRVTDATVREYRRLQERIGTTRAVIVQPAAYGTDNRVTVDAVAQLGPDAARGVAVALPSITDAELAALHEAGIRGLRFSIHDPHTEIAGADMIEPLALRIHELGWHVQLHARAEQVAALEPMLAALPCAVVLDHFARLPQPEGVHHPAMPAVRRLLDKGRTWVKLCAPYLDSRTGSPRYADMKLLAGALVKAAPERVVWGSDWPHPTEPHTKPDDAALLDLLQEWIGDEATRRRVLVSNPSALYGF
ncbi:MAG TPA: amidohydrolase family protein [Usitatibacter sp.]|nr:amidohydrolase family protein [Usitatibacter sp.]